jgi:hypothetical protein
MTPEEVREIVREELIEFSALYAEIISSAMLGNPAATDAAVKALSEHLAALVT